MQADAEQRLTLEQWLPRVMHGAAASIDAKRGGFTADEAHRHSTDEADIQHVRQHDFDAAVEYAGEAEVIAWALDRSEPRDPEAQAQVRHDSAARALQISADLKIVEAELGLGAGLEAARRAEVSRRLHAAVAQVGKAVRLRAEAQHAAVHGRCVEAHVAAFSAGRDTQVPGEAHATEADYLETTLLGSRRAGRNQERQGGGECCDFRQRTNTLQVERRARDVSFLDDVRRENWLIMRWICRASAVDNRPQSRPFKATLEPFSNEMALGASANRNYWVAHAFHRFSGRAAGGIPSVFGRMSSTPGASGLSERGKRAAAFGASGGSSGAERCARRTCSCARRRCTRCRSAGGRRQRRNRRYPSQYPARDAAGR